ncbi:hypothetical protein [Bacillus sp. WP8]|nr:hypothetical protein [Bacillus sp. WP8]
MHSRKERVPERSEFNIREHRHAGLTPNARVCLHAKTADERSYCGFNTS